MEFNTEQLMAMGTDWAIKIVLALLIFIVGKWVAKKVTAVTSKLLQKAEVDPTLDKFLCNIVYTILLAADILAALD